MPEPLNLTKAQLIELRPDFSGRLDGGKEVTVQFNPDTLKLSFANQLVTPEGAGSQRGTPGRLQVGAGTTKLTLQLWFDATRSSEGGSPVNDVRDLTKQVNYFITPKPDRGSRTPRYTPPAVQFLWGTFHFDGLMDSVEETLDYWSNDGRPLRATMSLSLSQQKIEAFDLAARGAGRAPQIASLVGGGGGTNSSPPGTTAMTQAPLGVSLQSLTDASGQSDWQTIARANGIDNPRQLDPGQLINLSAVKPSIQFS